MEYHPYEFLEGHICVVAYCNVKLAFIHANFWFSFSNCFHWYIVSGPYRLDISCLNFWDEAWWFLSLRVFGLLSSSLLLFWLKCLSTFFRCLSNPGTYTELWTMSFIESTGVACSDSVSHNWVQVLSIPVLLLACSQRTNTYNCYTMCPEYSMGTDN